MSDEEVRALEREATTDPTARRALWIARARAGDLSLPTAAVALLVTRLELGKRPPARGQGNELDALLNVATTLRNTLYSDHDSQHIERGNRLCVLCVPDPDEDAIAVGVQYSPLPTTPLIGRGLRGGRHDVMRVETAGPWDQVGTYFPDLDGGSWGHARELAVTRHVVWSRRELPDRVRLPRSIARDVCVEVFRLSTLGTAPPLVPPISEDYRRLRERLNAGEVRFPDGRAFTEVLRSLSLSTSEAALAIEEFGRATGPFVCRGCGHLIHAIGRCVEGGPERSRPTVACGCMVGGIPAPPVQNFGPFCECGHGRLRHFDPLIGPLPELLAGLHGGTACLVGTAADPRIEADRITGRTPSATELPRCPCLGFRGTAETQERRLAFSPEEVPTPRGEACGSCGREIVGDHAWLDSRTRVPIPRGRLLVASGSVFCCSGHALRPDGDQPHHG